ncbi:MAG: DUF4349 domain-containing protein [Methylocystaceae bacterium]
MKCHECLDLLSPYVDNMTNDEENKRITVHLATCRSCYRDMQQMKLLLEGIGFSKGEVTLPDGYTEELHERLLAHKTSLWGRQQALPTSRTGGWIAASVAAFALGAGIWMSSFVPYAQVADTLQKVAPAVFDRGSLQVKPAIEKLIAETAKEMQIKQNNQTPGQVVTPGEPQKVAVNEPQNPGDKTSPPAVNSQQPATVIKPIVKPETPKVAAVVAMQVAVENLDTAIHLLKSEGESQNATVAVANVNNIQTLSAGRDREVTIQVPQEQVGEWTNLLGELGEATPPSQRNQDLTKNYNSLNEQVASLQQQIAAPTTKNPDQLQAQLQDSQKQLQAIKDRLQMVTITVKLHEEVTP